MELRVTNTTNEAVPVRELYTSVPANDTLSTFAFFPGDVEKMHHLQELKADGTLEVVCVYTDDEKASMLLTQPQATQASAISPVLSTVTPNDPDQASVPVIIRRSFAALVTGVPDDVIIFGEGLMPDDLGPGYRLVDAMAVVSAAVALSTLTIRNRAAGAGDQLAVLDAATTGLKRATALGAADASVRTTLDATHGLVIRRSDRAIAGEVILTLIKENIP